MDSIDQLNLYAHSSDLKYLINLDKKNMFPAKILFSGKKGIGKSILAYHLVNYLFSLDEINKYDSVNFKINHNNKSYQLIKNNLHPNFYKINLDDDKKNIDISKIRSLISFLNLSTFRDQKRIIFIDDVEYLNLSSINALLKSLEEPNNNTYFILIHNNEKRITDTLKSRCIEYKLSINYENNKSIINNIFNDKIFENTSIDFLRYLITPYLYINFYNLCKNENLEYDKVTIEDLLKHVISNNLFKKKDFHKLDIKLYIEIFFRKKAKSEKSDYIFKMYNYFNKKYYEYKKFNIDMESFFLEFKSKLLNE